MRFFVHVWVVFCLGQQSFIPKTTAFCDGSFQQSVWQPFLLHIRPTDLSLYYLLSFFTLFLWMPYYCSRDFVYVSPVGIATRYGLDGPGIESQLGARFSAPVQTGPGAHPASCTVGTGSFPALKRPGRGVDHPPLYSAEVGGRSELYICSPSGPSWPVIGWPLPLPLPFTCRI
jgi:hypothetical protein